MLDGRCGIVLFYVCSPWLGMGSTRELCLDLRVGERVLGSDGTLGMVYTGDGMGSTVGMVLWGEDMSTDLRNSDAFFLCRCWLLLLLF